MLSDFQIAAIWQKTDNPGSSYADFARAIEAAARKDERERCAVAAWNHYMDECKKMRASASANGHWLAANAIRALKDER